MVVIYLVFTVILFHMTGDKFIAAANALNGTSSWKLPVTPFWLPLAGIGVNSSFLTAVLSLTFLLWFPLVLCENAAQPTRALFAWSFDGLLPSKVAEVNERTGVPIAAITITFIGIVVATVWAVWSSSFNTVLATTTLMLIVPMMFVGLSATLLPFTKPDLWQASPIRGRFLGIPVLSAGWCGRPGGIDLYLHDLLGLHEAGPAGPAHSDRPDRARGRGDRRVLRSARRPATAWDRHQPQLRGDPARMIASVAQTWRRTQGSVQRRRWQKRRGR